MSDYSNGKIYKIEPLQPETKDDIYIGSTTKEYLSQRLASHKYGYTSWKKTGEKKLAAYDLFEKYGFENCKIVLLENVDCSSKDELISVENRYIHDIPCVNIQGKKAYSKKKKEEILNEIEAQAKEFDNLMESNENNELKEKINIKCNDDKPKKTKAKTEANDDNTKPKKEVTEAMREHLAAIRIKASEAKKQKKIQRLKSKNLETLKYEIKAKEYDKLKDIANNNAEPFERKFMHYGQIIDIYEKKFNKNLLEILIEYQDLKSVNLK